MNQKIIQAYRQAPWRVQLQWIGVFLLVLVVAIGASGIYLYVSAQATAAGANIHSLEIQREELTSRIADLRTQVAYANSAVVMEVRAEKLGFRHAQQEDLIYLAVPGYTGRAPVFSTLQDEWTDRGRGCRPLVLFQENICAVCGCKGSKLEEKLGGWWPPQEKLEARFRVQQIIRECG